MHLSTASNETPDMEGNEGDKESLPEGIHCREKKKVPRQPHQTWWSLKMYVKGAEEASTKGQVWFWAGRTSGVCQIFFLNNRGFQKKKQHKQQPEAWKHYVQELPNGIKGPEALGKWPEIGQQGGLGPGCE